MIHETKPTLLMLVGLPGAGKSTAIKQWENELDFVTLSTDDYIEKVAQERGLTYDEVFSGEVKRANGFMRQSLRNALSENKNIVWDQTNLSPKSRKKKLKGIPDRYYKVAVVFDVDDVEIEKRLSKRSKETGKTIPLHVLKGMKESFVYPTREEGFDRVIKGKQT